MGEDARSRCTEFLGTDGQGELGTQRARGFFFFCITVACGSDLQFSRTLVIKPIGRLCTGSQPSISLTMHASKIHSSSNLSLVGPWPGQRRRGSRVEEYGGREGKGADKATKKRGDAVGKDLSGIKEARPQVACSFLVFQAILETLVWELS